MTDWMRKPLSDLAYIRKDIWKDGEENLPYIGLEHIGEGSLRLISIGESKSVHSNKYYFSEENFLFGKLRPYFRKVVRPKFRGVCSTDIWVVGAKEGIDLLYLFYFFANKEFVDLAHLGSSGTKMPRADWDYLKKTEWKIPTDIREQQVIGRTLQNLDDKIDLSRRENETLEALAETIFRQWFVEEAKDDWEDGVLGDVVDLCYGKGLRKDLRDGGLYPVVGSSGIIDFHSEFLVESPGIVIGRKGTLGKTIYIEENFFPIDTTYYVNVKRKTEYIFYEYFLFKSLRFGKMNTDSAVPGLNRNIALGIPIIKPPEKLRNEFNSIIAPMFEKKKNNKAQIITLEQLRDMLLPKLISGEVRVRYDEDH